MNIYDISQQAGVSIATVSRVLNGHTRVSEKTRKKVLQVIEESGYRPNAFARGLGLNTMHTIGILCPDCSDSYLAEAVYYLEQELRKYQYDVLLYCTGYQLEQKQHGMHMLLDKRVDAVILAGSTFAEPAAHMNEYLLKASRQVPLILLNSRLEGPNIYSSLCNDEQAVNMAASKLLKEGFKKPLFLYRAPSYSGIRKRTGFEQALARAGLSLQKEQLLCQNGTISEIRDLLLSYYENTLAFDSVIASDDELAIGALKFARAKHLWIPKECSIIGYNNSKLGLCCDPELTTIDNKLEFSCKNAVTLLIDVLEGKEVPKEIVISADLLQRGTTISN